MTEGSDQSPQHGGGGQVQPQIRKFLFFPRKKTDYKNDFFLMLCGDSEMCIRLAFSSP
ncbi:MAG: hypothetical protein ACK5H1_00200 [Tenacibaculum sp.]